MSKNLFILAGALFAASCAAQTTNSACSGISLGPNGSLNGFVPSPSDAWHQSIVSAPIDPNSNKIMTTSGDLGSRFLHPDFASANYGIPYVVVDSSALTSVPVPISLYPADSDITLFPIPATLPVEGNPSNCPTDSGDRHALIVDKNTCVVYELYQANYCNSQWGASGSTVWDMTLTEKRPYGLSSVDAAGLSVFEGILRYDEILSGSVNHALRFTAAHTKANANNGVFTAPATHAAGNLWGTDNIMGMRIRLNANFDISSFSPTNQIILKAMKTYGMILADNGSDMFFQGTIDSRWDDNDLNALKNVPSSAFDVVQMGPIYDSATAPTGPAPVITSFTASANNVAPGTPVTLTPVVSNGSYMFIDLAGFTRGTVTVTPSATTTYNLSARNAFGTTNASVTVNVGGGPSTSTLAFTPIPTQVFGAAPFQVSASSSSPAPITYSVVSGPATIAGTTVSLTGPGTVTLAASQAATTTYAAATVSISFTVNPASSSTPTIAFAAIASKTLGTAPFAVSATSNSNGAITYSIAGGPATISGNTVSVTGAGTVTVKATQAPSAGYSAGSATASFSVAAATPSLTIAPIGTKTTKTAPFTVTASSNSTGAITYSIASGPATVSGNTVTVTGAGTVSLKASQAAAGNYAAAFASTSFTVTTRTTKTSHVLSFAGVHLSAYKGAPIPLRVSSNSPAPVVFSLISGPAKLVRNSVTFNGPGYVTLLATQAATSTYNAGKIHFRLLFRGTCSNGVCSGTVGTSER